MMFRSSLLAVRGAISGFFRSLNGVIERYRNFRLPLIALIPILIFFVFAGLAVFSFLLMRSDETGLRDLNAGILQQRAALIDFQLAAQKTVGQLYEMTATAGLEINPARLQKLQEQSFDSLKKLDAAQDILMGTLAHTNISPDTIRLFDALMDKYTTAGHDVADMVTTDTPTAMSWMTQTRSKFVRLDEIMDSMRNDLTAQKEVQLDQLMQTMAKGRYIFAAIILVVSLIIVFLAFVLRRFVATIDTLNASMTAMLDGLGQGLLFFDARGVVSPVYSKACEMLLEGNPANKNITEVFKLSAEDSDVFQSALQMLFEGRLPLGFNDWVAMVPKTYRHGGGLAISLAYRPIVTGPNGALKSILLVATDRTQEKKIEQIIKENEIAAMRTLRISRNRNHFIRFVRHFNAIIASPALSESAVSSEQVRRDIHTLKGTADTFHLGALAERLHKLETDIPLDAPRPRDIIEAHRVELMEAFQGDITLAYDVLGEDFQSTGESRTIPESQLYSVAAQMQSDLDSGASAQQIYQVYLQKMLAVPIWKLMDDFATSLQELGDRFGKPIYPCAFAGENFSILPGIYDPLFSSFIHIARNIVDHGVESSFIRRQHKKDPMATVTVRTQTFLKDSATWFSIEFTDDGGGVNVDVLRTKLANQMPQNDFDRMDDQSVIQHIFDSNISTKERSTLFSGRGMGLSAVKAEVTKLGGTISVFSKFEQGVTIRVELPLIKALTLGRET